MTDPMPNDTIKTFSGQRWSLLSPKPGLVRIEDIAHSLGNLCRFNGHTARFYSVAQHAVLVALEVMRRTREDAELALWALHHDDEEAYLGDVVRPLKRLDVMAPVREAGVSTQRAICEHLGLPPVEPDIVAAVDKDLLRTEQRDLMMPFVDGKGDLDAPYDPGQPLTHLEITLEAPHLGSYGNLFQAAVDRSIEAVVSTYCYENEKDVFTVPCWSPRRATATFLAFHEHLST